MKSTKIAGIICSAAIAMCPFSACSTVLPTENYQGAGDLVGMTVNMTRTPNVYTAEKVQQCLSAVQLSDNNFSLSAQEMAESGVYYSSNIMLSDGNSVVERELTDGSISIDNQNNRIYISEPGFYRFSGKLSDGRIISTANGNVCFILDQVEISSSLSAPVVFNGTGEKVITLAKNTANQLKNALSDMLLSTESEGVRESVVFSNGSITINGTGELIAQGLSVDGIKSNDDIKITSGEITVSSLGEAVMAKNVFIKGGEISLESKGGDGIKVRRDVFDGSCGGIFVQDGGTLRITSAFDSIFADKFIKISGADTKLSVLSGNGADSQWYDEIYSRKGMRSAGHILIESGSVGVDSLDDAINAAGELLLGDVSLSLCSRKIALNSDFIMLSAGRTEIRRAETGINATQMQVLGGALKINNVNNAIKLQVHSTLLDGCDCAYIQTGGTVDIASRETSVNIRGKMIIDGGFFYCSGGCQNKKAAIEVTDGFKIDGGKVMIIAPLGMIQTPVVQSKQKAVTFSFKYDLQVAASVALKKLDNVLFSREIAVSCGSIMFSSPDFADENEYSLEINGDVQKTFVPTEGHMEIGVVA